MKKILLTLLLATAIFPAIAQESNPQLRVFLVADTWDPAVGDFAQKQLRFLKNWIDDVVAASLNMPISKESSVYDSTRCCYDTLMAALENYHCDTNDIVIFWYLGHGIRSIHDTSKFPQMCLHSRNNDKFISLEAVKKHLMKQNPRLCVVVGDCCNSTDSNVTAKNELVFASRNNRGGTTINLSTKNFAQALFGESEGCYIISASSAGEYSYSNNSEGFFFTNNFIKNFKKLSAITEINGNPWDELMTRLQIHFDNTEIAVEDEFGDVTYEKMHPTYAFEPRKMVRQRKKYVYKIDNSLVEALQLLIKDSNNENTGKVLSQYFADNARVYILGSEEGTYIDIPTAEEYLYRISGLDELEKISVRAMKTDSNNKVRYLYVNEVYNDNDD